MSGTLVLPSRVKLRLQIDPICVVGATQILEGLIHVIAGEVVAEAGLKLQERCWLAGRNEINFLPGETAILRVDAVAARRARRLVGLVKEVARGGQPEDVVGECDREALCRGNARFEVRIERIESGNRLAALE
jgi:hypothetical protein